MAEGVPTLERVVRAGPTLRLLDRRLGRAFCIASWCLATLLYVTLIAAVGGPTTSDASESVVPTQAIAHGDFRCAYPMDNATPMPPLYPLVSGAAVAILALPPQAGYPTAHEVGPDCRHAGDALFSWTLRHGGKGVLWVGVLGWLDLLAGFVVLLRSVGRGRSGWEVAGVMVLALLPATGQCLTSYYHPNDLLAVGLILMAMAAYVSKKFGAMGVALGLAVLSQQFALLAALPLLVITPTTRWLRATVAAVLTVGSLSAIAWALMGWGSVAATAGEDATYRAAGTLIDGLDLKGTALVAVSRCLPIALSVVLALVVRRRAGAAASTLPVAVSLVGLCLGLRLVFETSLFPYYLMAAAISLVALDWVAGRLRWATVLWLVAEALLFPPLEGGLSTWTTHLVLGQLLLLPAYFLVVGEPVWSATRVGRGPRAVSSSPERQGARTA